MALSSEGTIREVSPLGHLPPPPQGLSPRESSLCRPIPRIRARRLTPILRQPAVLVPAWSHEGTFVLGSGDCLQSTLYGGLCCGLAW